jgi:signal transduction histidine kinase
VRRLSLRVRLALFFAGMLVAAIVCFAANVWWVEGRLGAARVDRELDGLAGTVSTVIAAELREGVSIAEASQEAAATIPVSDRAVALFEADGTVIATSGEAPPWPLEWALPGVVVRRDVATSTTAWRIRVDSRSYEGRPRWMMVASSLSEVERQQHEVLETMWFAIPFAVLLAGAGGLWMASRTIRPIEDALRAQRQFMADASHELRTPVSIVRTASEVSLSAAYREEPDYREALAIVSSQAGRLSRLVESMFMLARADADGHPLRRVDLYLDEIVGECCRAATVLCDERRVAIQRGTWDEIPFCGDEDLLRRMIVNLLTNAVQHSPADGVVAVEVVRRDREAVISVRDGGSGIPVADQARIFDRFVRLDPARSGSGAGLGLPIARSIAEAHGGTLVLAQSGSDGSRFVVALPVETGVTRR